MGSREKISRKLTAGEKSLVTQVYKNSVNTGLVRVLNEKYAPFQSDDVLMTPDGNIYAGTAYLADYSTGSSNDASVFIHEMAHVWQKQNNVLDPTWAAVGEFFRNGFNYDAAYDYDLDAKKDLLDYAIEQQAQIIQDYFQIFHQKRGPWGNNMKNNVGTAERDKLFKAVLARFIANPSYPNTADKEASGSKQGYSGGGYSGGASGSW